MKTFSITTLGCRVNHYESEQLAALFRGRGLTPASSPGEADLRVVHTCSVTVQAASKSRQSVRRLDRLRVLNSGDATRGPSTDFSTTTLDQSSILHTAGAGSTAGSSGRRQRVVVTGCWATSHPKEAAALSGVDAVLGHHHDVNSELERLLDQWDAADEKRDAGSNSPEPGRDDGWMKGEAGTLAGLITCANEPKIAKEVNGKLEGDENPCEGWNEGASGQKSGARSQKSGMTLLPLLGERQGGHQRAFLKVQDGCDAHCTYCIIPQLRPRLWSKPVDEAVEEARRLVEAGHVEIVLTGIFLGAYGQATALRRRQGGQVAEPLGELVDALCRRVPGLGRLRLSSLEPGDLTDELLTTLRSHRQVVPHFHLPLQSGSDVLLRRMNRQYGRRDYLEMIERLEGAFDEPAITTDVIVGFPGETDEEFARTVEVVDRARFIHIHAFSYSPRPKTAAARWTKDHVRGLVVNRRIDELRERAAGHSLAFRRKFVGRTVELLVERPTAAEREIELMAGYQHGRCERYFAVHFEGSSEGSGFRVQGSGLRPGTLARVRVDRVTGTRTFGTLVGVGR